jgi:formate-dependent phosphoribosylglycinamide formyltransferase (GAR transformylase)
MAVPGKALLVGSSFSAAPMFFSLKKHGLHVSVCGRITTDPCHQYADASFFVDYSRPDEFQKLIASEKFDYLVSTCNDSAYMACAHVATRYGFPGYDVPDVASTLHIKPRFRQALQRLGIPAPIHFVLTKGQAVDASALPYPLLAKPADSFSGRGITLITSPEALDFAVEHAFAESRSSAIVLEEFIDGSLHSHSAFIEDGKIKFDCFVDEFCTVYPYQVNCSNHPSALPITCRAAIRTAVSKLIESLKLRDGLLHTQFIANDSRVWIIETMRRCPGDLYGNLIAYSTGIDYADLIVRPFLGLKYPQIVPYDPPTFFSRHTISVPKPMAFFSFTQSIPAKSVHIVPIKQSGERLSIAPWDKLAVLFSEFETYDKMIDVTPRQADMVVVKGRIWE